MTWFFFVPALGIFLGFVLAIYADVDGAAAWASCLVAGIIASVLLVGLVTLAGRLFRRRRKPSNDNTAEHSDS